MPVHFIPFVYTIIFAVMVVASIPKLEMRRLGIYGILLGALVDILFIIFGKVSETFEYINFGPFGFMGIPFFPPISWALFFMLYFYFLPKEKITMYIYMVTAIIYGLFFGNLIMNLGVIHLSFRLLPLLTFGVWFPIATWIYLKLNSKLNV